MFDLDHIRRGTAVKLRVPWQGPTLCRCSERVDIVDNRNLPQQHLADDVRRLDASVKIAAVPVLPAGRRLAKSASSSFTRTAKGVASISFGVTASPRRLCLTGRKGPQYGLHFA